MKSIIKTLLFGMFLLVAVGVKAQEEKQETKYEYAVIRQGGVAPSTIFISIEGKPLEIKKINGTKWSYDVKALLEEVAKLQEEGWRVINTTNDNSATSFFLRRKK